MGFAEHGWRCCSSELEKSLWFAKPDLWCYLKGQVTWSFGWDATRYACKPDGLRKLLLKKFLPLALIVALWLLKTNGVNLFLWQLVTGCRRLFHTVWDLRSFSTGKLIDFVLQGLLVWDSVWRASRSSWLQQHMQTTFFALALSSCPWWLDTWHRVVTFACNQLRIVILLFSLTTLGVIRFLLLDQSLC